MTGALVPRPAPGPGFLTFVEAQEWSKALASSDLLPDDLAGKPGNVLLVGLWGQQVGVPFIVGLREVHVIEGRAEASARLQRALVLAAGHDLEFPVKDADRCVARGRRAGEADWEEVEATLDDARTAGLLDVTLEEWYVTAGGKNACRRWAEGDGEPPAWVAAAREKGSLKVRRRENWHRYPRRMLIAWATRLLCSVKFSDVILGLVPEAEPAAAAPAGPDLEAPDDAAEDAELVEEPAGWRAGLEDRLGRLDEDRAATLKAWWREARVPPLDSDGFRPDHAAAVHAELDRRGWAPADEGSDEDAA
jgi:hypothetical protein